MYVFTIRKVMEGGGGAKYKKNIRARENPVKKIMHAK